jgi:hypothetical protein
MEDNNLNAFQLGNISIPAHAICIFGVISQVLLIIALIKDPLKCFKNSGTYFVENLAVSDLFTCLLAPFTCCVPTKWYWQIHSTLFAITSVSVLTLASISLDRFLMVVYPLKHRVLMTGRIIIVWLACIWLLSSVYPIQIYLGDDMDLFKMYLLGGVVILFTGAMYGFTYYKLKKQSKNFARENVSARQLEARVMKEKRFLRTITLIACITVACLLPASTFYHYAVHKKLFIDGLAARILNGTFTGIFYVNFAVNPLVYVLRLPNYRKTFYLVYCCKRTAR